MTLFPVEGQELEAEASPGDNPEGSEVSRVLAAMEAKATHPDGMHGTVRLCPTGVESGPGVEGRVLLDTGIQISVISRGMLAKLQANYPLSALLTQRSFPVVLVDQAIAPAVGTTEPLNVIFTSEVARPVQLTRIVFTVLEGDGDMLLLGHPTMVAKLGIDVEKILTNLPANVAEGDIRCAVALAAARGANADPDPSAALLTHRAPPLISAPDKEMQEPFRLLTKGVDKAAQEGKGTEALDDLAQAV